MQNLAVIRFEIFFSSGLIIEPGSPAAGVTSKSGSGKSRAAFYLRTTPMTRASRRLCRDAVRLHHHARRPGKLIDLKAIKVDTFTKAKPLDPKAIIKLYAFSKKSRVKMDAVVQKLGLKDLSVQEWLILTPKDQIPKPATEMFPRPPKRPDGSYIYERIPPTAQAIKSVVLASGVPSDRYTGPQSQLFKKRPYEDKPPVTIDVPAKLQRTGKNWHFNFGLF